MTEHQYGMDADTLEKFIIRPKIEPQDFGSLSVIVSLPEYRLDRLELLEGKQCSLDIEAEREATIFVEKGALHVNDTALQAGELISVSPEEKILLVSDQRALAYIFWGAPTVGKKHFQRTTTFDRREKYWGYIETIVSGEYAAKRIFVRKGEHSSLEYHIQKLESYFVHSGQLFLRLRAGRGEDRFFELPPNTATITPPGLMHQRGALEDALIIEISTRDDDSDSYLVEDGQKHPMPRLALRQTTSQKGRVCFDIDGVIRTQTEGDYENAKPIPEAVSLINKLYDEGYRITLYTSSFMGRNKDDQRAAYETGYAFNKKQLSSFGVKYHDLFMGKPPSDILVDDRALFFQPDWELIEKQIRDKLKDAK